MNDFLYLLIILFTSFALCYLFCKCHLKLVHYTPIDRDEVKSIRPYHHFVTLGGIDIIFSILLTTFFFNISFTTNKNLYGFVLLILPFFLLGFIDDLLKRKNHKGLSVSFRILCEIIFVFLFLSIEGLNMFRFIHIPLLHSSIYLGILTILYIVFVILGTVNSVNFADGLDGLVTGLLICAFTPFIFISIQQENKFILYLLLTCIGALLAYLCFNFNPSKLIMGDCGSLPLGAILAYSALSLNHEILLLVAGIVFIMEILSVILQVGYFKYSHGKRIFKMTPLHYHFIKSNWSESKVVLFFLLLGVISALIASIIGVME